MLVTLKTFWIF